MAPEGRRWTLGLPRELDGGELWSGPSALAHQASRIRGWLRVFPLRRVGRRRGTGWNCQHVRSPVISVADERRQTSCK